MIKIEENFGWNFWNYKHCPSETEGCPSVSKGCLGVTEMTCHTREALYFNFAKADVFSGSIWDDRMQNKISTTKCLCHTANNVQACMKDGNSEIQSMLSAIYNEIALSILCITSHHRYSCCVIFRSKIKALRAMLPSFWIFMCVWVGTYHILREKTEIEKKNGT